MRTRYVLGGIVVASAACLLTGLLIRAEPGRSRRVGPISRDARGKTPETGGHRGGAEAPGIAGRSRDAIQQGGRALLNHSHRLAGDTAPSSKPTAGAAAVTHDGRPLTDSERRLLDVPLVRVTGPNRARWLNWARVRSDGGERRGRWEVLVKRPYRRPPKRPATRP